MLLKLSHKVEREVMFSNLFYGTNIILIQKLNKDTHKKKEKHGSMSLMNIDGKILNKMFQTKFNNTLKRSYTMIRLVSRMFQHVQINKCNIEHKLNQEKSP
jgi:hypothetical protein